MPGADRDADLTAEDMLRAMEQREAQEMRNELLGVLKSEECRGALEEAVRKALEATVDGVLSRPKPLEKFRGELVSSLTPGIDGAVKTAANEALNTFKAEMKSELEERLKKPGAITNMASLSEANAKASREIKEAIAALRAEVLTAAGQLRAPAAAAGQTEPEAKAPAFAAAQPVETAARTSETAPGPARNAEGFWGLLPPRATNRKPRAQSERPLLGVRLKGGYGWIVVVLVLLAIGYAAIAFVMSLSKDPLIGGRSGQSEQQASSSATPASPGATSRGSNSGGAASGGSTSGNTASGDSAASGSVSSPANTTLPPVALQRKRAFDAYLAAIAKFNNKIAPATSPQLNCLSTVSEKLPSMALGPLRAAMRNCDALRAAPVDATRFVANVQQRLRGMQTCPGVGRPTVDGYTGKTTDAAIGAYLTCIKSADVWNSPTLGDYIALGLYLTALDAKVEPS